MHSPLATSKQWSDLSKEAREALAEEGEHLWHDLIKLLQPDVIVASLPIADVERTCRRLSTNGSERDEAVELHQITEKKDGEDRSSDYVVKGWWREVGEHPALVVYGKKAEVPFGTISDDQKREVGHAIRDEIFSG